MSPEGSEIENAGPSTSVTTPPSPLNEALAVIVHGCDMAEHATAAASRADRRSVCSTPMKIAQIAPPWFAVPPPGYGGIELVVALLADGFAEPGPRRHPVRERRFRRPRPRSCRRSIDPPDPALLGNVVVRRATTRLASYLAIGDEFDVVHDHSGIIGPAMGALRARHPPVVHTLHGPWTEPSRRFYGLLARPRPSRRDQRVATGRQP